MNTLTDRLDRLAERGPHADASLVVARATAIATGTALAEEPAPQRPRRAPLVAAAVTVTVLGGGLLLATRPTSDRGAAPGNTDPSNASGPTTSVPSALPLEPVATLPDTGDVSSQVPVTVVGTGPTDWYRLQPDLDIAWYSPNDGTSWLCLRTPTIDATCQIDQFAPTANGGGPIGVATAGNQMLVLTLDPGDTITLTTSSQTPITAPVVRDPQIGWGIARVPLDDYLELTGLRSLYMPPDPTATNVAPTAAEPSVPGRTDLPPGMADITESVATDASRQFATTVAAALTELGWDVELREHATRITDDGTEVEWASFADGADRRLFLVAGGPDLDNDSSVEYGTVAERRDTTQTLIAYSEPVDSAPSRSHAELTSLLTALP